MSRLSGAVQKAGEDHEKRPSLHYCSEGRLELSRSGKG